MSRPRGLHSEDIAKLLQVLSRFVDDGNTVLVIEHNLDVIKTADHIIDLDQKAVLVAVRLLRRVHRKKSQLIQPAIPAGT